MSDKISITETDASEIKIVSDDKPAPAPAPLKGGK
jgi:hypothetical protein